MPLNNASQSQKALLAKADRSETRLAKEHQIRSNYDSGGDEQEIRRSFSKQTGLLWRKRRNKRMDLNAQHAPLLYDGDVLTLT